jgi:hypothetical protein
MEPGQRSFYRCTLRTIAVVDRRTWYPPGKQKRELVSESVIF